MATEKQEFKWVGTRPIRPDGMDKVSGRGKFGADLHLPGMLVGRVLRSPHAHADIISMDTKTASNLPGVIGVFTGKGYAEAELGNVAGNSPPKRRNGDPGFRPPRPAKTSERVRHVGQLFAMVVAETINAAKDAIEAIDVEYK